MGTARSAIEQRRHLAIDVELALVWREGLKLGPELVVRPHRPRFPASGIESAPVEPRAEANRKRRAGGRQRRAVRIEEAIEKRQADADGGAAHHSSQDAPAAQFGNGIQLALSSMDAPRGAGGASAVTR